MQYWLEGFFSALLPLGVVLVVRLVKTGFKSGIQPESSFND